MLPENRIVVTRKHNRPQQDLPRDFNEDIGDEEGSPAVGLARAFADFVQGALGDEARHYLLDEGAEDGSEHEDREDDVLEALLR